MKQKLDIKSDKRQPIRAYKIDNKDKNINQQNQQRRPLTSSTNTNSKPINRSNNTNNIITQTKNSNSNNIPRKKIDKPEIKTQQRIEQKKTNNIINHSSNIQNNSQKTKTVKNLNPQSPLNENNPLIQLPSKMELDNKALKLIMPYFDKNMSYTKKQAKNEEKVILLYDNKINELVNIYSFTEKYLFFITQTFGKICNPFYQIISITYNNDIKPYFAYFKNLVNIFETFSDNLKTLGHSIKHPLNEEENNNISELMNVEFDLNKSVEKLNLIYADIFSIITNNLKENVLNKPLYNKVDTVEPKFVENLQKMQKLINKLIHRREKLINKYKKEYEPLFYYYKDRKEKKAIELFNDLICMKDFLFMEYDLISYCNKAFVKTKKFLIDIELVFNDSTNLFCDYLEALKTMIKIYYDENRFIINPNILSKDMINNLNQLIEQDIRKKIEKKLSIKNIIEFSKEPKLRNEMNHLLLNYRDILIQSQILIEKNQIIEEITNFNLLNFKSTKYFFSFLLDLVPQIRKFNYEKFIQLKLYIKRDAGLFKKWRNTILLVTYQGHILFLDESSNISNNERIKEFTNNSTQVKENEGKEKITKEESKDTEKNEQNNEIIVKDEFNDGIVPNKLIHIFLKTSYGILIKEKKDDKFLFQLWSYLNGNKKSKEVDFDALNQDNLTKIINILNDNNDVNLTQIDK